MPSKVDRPEVLRLIYQGRFLHENVTLDCMRIFFIQIFFIIGKLSLFKKKFLALNIQPGRTCVMHLVPREKIPEPNIGF